MLINWYINHVDNKLLEVSSQIVEKSHTAETAKECLLLCISQFISCNDYWYLHSVAPQCSTHFWSVEHVHRKLPKFTMTQKVYFHVPKCAFNPDHIWDQKWNYVDPLIRNVFLEPEVHVLISRALAFLNVSLLF